jgi:hypothetical protein
MALAWPGPPNDKWPPTYLILTKKVSQPAPRKRRARAASINRRRDPNGGGAKSLNRPPFRRPDLLKETGSAERSNKPLSSRSPTLAKPTARSRLTNGKELLPGVDGRSLWARRFRDVLALHLSDLGGEGQSVRSGEGNRAASGLSHCRARADRS